MNWKHYFTTSIGKKLVMGFTGLFLISFLIVHCYVNSMIFVGKDAFNAAADFMGTTIAIRILEIGLFAGIILHIVQGYMLATRNMSTRKERYAVKPGNKTSAWYSRSMGLLGTLILLFLVIHISHFWVPSRITGLNETTLATGREVHDLFQRMVEVFHDSEWSIVVVVVYLLGVFSLAWHLIHGFYSAFQTMGLTTHKYKRMIRNIGIVFTIVVCLLFAAMPVSMYMGWVS